MNALELAEVSPYLEGGERGRWIIDAAAELRRLSAVEAQRDALLEALKMMRDKYGEYACSVCDHADAAIKAVEGEKE